MKIRLISMLILTGLVLSGCGDSESKEKDPVVSARSAEETPAEATMESEADEETLDSTEGGLPPATDSSGFPDLKEADRLEEEDPFTRVGEWKVLELQKDQFQAINLVRQAKVNETYSFGDMEVHLETVDIIQFLDTLEGLDEFTQVKVEEEELTYGIQVTYKARKVSGVDGEDLYYLGLSNITTSEGQSMVQYEPKGEFLEEPDVVSYEWSEVNFATIGKWEETEVISILEPGTFDQISWVEISLGATGKDAAFVEGDWGKYVKDIGSTVRIPF